MYQAAFNTISLNSKAGTVIKIIFLITSMLICSFVGVFTKDYNTDADGQGTA